MRPEEIEDVKRRFRRKVIGNLIAVVMGAPPSFVLVEAATGNSAILGAHSLASIIASVVVVVAAAVFVVVNWRCPWCGGGFGSAIYPPTCPHCTAKLR